MNSNATLPAWKHVHKEYCLQHGRLPCPLKEELGCQNTFACVDSARNHAKQVHASRVKNSNSHVRVERIRAARGLSTRKWVWSVILPCLTGFQSHVYSKIIEVVKRLLARKAEPKLMLRLHMDIDSLVRGKRISVVRRTLPHRVVPRRMQGGCTFVNVVQFRCVGMQSPRDPCRLWG